MSSHSFEHDDCEASFAGAACLMTGHTTLIKDCRTYLQTSALPRFMSVKSVDVQLVPCTHFRSSRLIPCVSSMWILEPWCHATPMVQLPWLMVVEPCFSRSKRQQKQKASGCCVGRPGAYAMFLLGFHRVPLRVWDKKPAMTWAHCNGSLVPKQRCCNGPLAALCKQRDPWWSFNNAACCAKCYACQTMLMTQSCSPTTLRAPSSGLPINLLSWFNNEGVNSEEPVAGTGRQAGAQPLTNFPAGGPV